MPHRVRRRLLIGLSLAGLALIIWLGIFATQSALEGLFVATILVASSLLIGAASRRAWFGLACANILLGLIWASSALKFRYLAMPAIAPDLYYFFSLDTLKVIAGYPLLATACAALLLIMPLLIWLAWHADQAVDFAHYPPRHQHWPRRIGVSVALITLIASLTPQGLFANVYGKPMWLAVNDQSFIADFIISIYDTRIHIPSHEPGSKAAIDWSAAPGTTTTATAEAGISSGTPAPDIVSVLEESTFDPAIMKVCAGQPVCRSAMFAPDARTMAHGLLGVHTFGGGTWTAEFALITGLAHTLFGNAGLYAPYNLAPLMRFSIARSLKARGYRVVALYPTSAEFLNGRNAYRDYGFDALYDGAELGLKWGADDRQILELFWQLYQREKEQHPQQPLFFMVLTLHQHGPHMTPLAQLPPPYDKPLFPHRFSSERGLDDWLNLNVGNYLQRNHESELALATLEQRLFEREQPTVLLHFGDHQPSFDGAMMAVEQQLPDDWGDNPHWATYYMLKSNVADAPRFDYPQLSIVYLGGLLLQAAGIPENAYYAANRIARERCHGRYENCANAGLVASYQDYVFRRLKVLER